MVSDLRATLVETNWNEEWKALQAARHPADDPAFWDSRAHHFQARETHPYARAFIERAAVAGGESLLDMGCGAGSLAIPYGLRGNHVLACDFSPRMLDVLGEGIRVHHLETLVTPKLLAWDDDWDAAGMQPKSVDVAIASRSIATHDLAAALLKLDRTARRRCCITLIATGSPRVDRHIMDAIGASVTESHDYVYAFNILVRLGRHPEVSYIISPRRDTFNTLDEGVADFARMLEGGNEERLPELRTYLAHHMVENPEAGMPGEKGRPQGAYMLDHVREVCWAFIAWKPQELDEE